MKFLFLITLLLLAGCQIISSPRPLARAEYLDTLISANEGNPHAQFLRGKRYLQEGEPRKAVRDIKEAISLQPNRADLQIALGAVYQSQRKWGLAEKSYLHALELDHNSAQPMILLARLAWMRGNLDVSRKWISKASQIDDSAELWKVKGETAYISQDYDQAVQDWKESLKRDSSQPLLQEILADLQVYLGQKP